MQMKKFSTSIRPVITAFLITGCAAKPISFDGHQVVYRIDPVFTTAGRVAKDANIRCSSEGKRAIYLRQDCPSDRNCTVVYECK